MLYKLFTTLLIFSVANTFLIISKMFCIFIQKVLAKNTFANNYSFSILHFYTRLLVARGGFGLRSASVGAKPRSTGPRLCALGTTPWCLAYHNLLLIEKKDAPTWGTLRKEGAPRWPN